MSNNPIRILQVQCLPLLSGVQNVMLHLIEKLPSDQFEFTVISAPNGPLISRLKELHVRHIPIPELRRELYYRDPIALYKIYRICKKEKFDIVHTHSSKTGFIGRIAARCAGVSHIIHTVHGFPFHAYQLFPIYLLYQQLETIAAHFCDRIITVNKADAEYLHSHRPSTSVRVIYNGVSEMEVTPSLYKKEDFGFTASDCIVGSICRFDTQKNILNTIDAAIHVVAREPQIKFIFIGNGKFFSDAKKKVHDAHLTDSILLPGWKTNGTEWLRIFDIFLLYSRWEGLPLSILEAMEAGLPIIASNIQGNNELVHHAENGLLVSLDSLEELSAAIIELAKNTGRKERMGEKSREIIRRNFSLDQFLSSYAQEYKSFVGRV